MPQQSGCFSAALRSSVLGVFLAIGSIAIGTPAHAGAILCSVHCTDGGFNLHNGGSPTSDATEWGGATVNKQFFPPVGISGNAYLYVDQGSSGGVVNDTLFLMYDYLGGTTMSSFFDVFFQVIPDAHDYLVHITPTGIFGAWEKPIGTVSGLNPDGSFDFTSSPWTPLDPIDLQLAQFRGAVGFGPSPNSSTPHLLAEFQLTINHSPDPSHPNGIYSPEPAFWSASSNPKTGPDPPISSGIFTLNPDGSTIVSPVFGPNGGPAQQPQDVVPEPGTISMFACAAIGLLCARRRIRG